MPLSRSIPSSLTAAALCCLTVLLFAQSSYGDELIDRYESGERLFERVDIADKMIVYFHQRTIGEAVVEKDFIVYQFDAATGELLAKKTHWRADLPETLPPIAIDRQQAELAAEGRVQSATLYIVSPESDVFPFEPVPKHPCWVVRVLREGDLVVEVIDAVDGALLGLGVPPPYTAFSLTGPQYSSPCSGAWTPWSESAEYWFTAMGYSTEEVVWPEQSVVQGHIQSSETAMFYELAHGGSQYFASGCVGGQSYETTYASEISSWITAFTKVPFAFIGSCGGMCDTGPGTLSYAFRKGSSELTATVGYCNMAEPQCEVCWTYSLDWQDALFDYMSQGYTVKDAYDQADADYPQCASSLCMRFAGDELLAVVPIVVRDPGACLVAPNPVDFDTLVAGSYRDSTITIRNTWDGALGGVVSEACDHFEIISGGGPYTLGPGDSLEVTVRYEPANGGAHQCTVETGDALCADIHCLGFARSPIHYVSPYGANVAPYATPVVAAHAVADAVAAADAGDSVLVVSGTFLSGQMVISRGIGLYGAWDSTFTTRSPAVEKTAIDLGVTGRLHIGPGVQTCVVDGFSIQNGQGMNVVTSSVTVVESEVRSSTMGGLCGAGSTLYLDRCTIADNTSGRGAGICLDDCTGSMSNSVVSGNELVLTSDPPNGGGMALLNCNSFTIVGVVVEDNSAGLSGSNGGGVYVENSRDIEISGGALSGNHATFGGGGVYATASEVGIRGVELGSNSGLLGGAVNASGAGTVTIEGCGVTGNTATLGGGLYLSGTEIHVDHNLVVANNGAASGGGCYFLATGGSFIGNTLDGNTSSLGGGAYFSNTSVPVVNNIVTGSTGSGIKCSGGTIPTPTYCDSWNNTTNYDGVTPGVGCISLDPLYVNASGGDYHLGLHSPAIDTGDPDVSRNDPDGSRGDMGMYGSHAFTMDQPEYPKGLVGVVVSGNMVVRWNQNPEGDVASYAVYKDTDPDFVPSLTTFLGLVSAPDTTHDDGAYVDGVYYKVSAVDADGYAGGYAGPVEGEPTGIGDVVGSVATRLHQNHPNPFNPSTRIRYEVASRVHVSLEVFDVRGALVRRLVEGEKAPGGYVAEWDGKTTEGERASTGVYFYRLTAGSFSETRKMVLLR
jgi:hypothetical protein